MIRRPPSRKAGKAPTGKATVPARKSKKTSLVRKKKAKATKRAKAKRSSPADARAPSATHGSGGGYDE
jgi:hypothetical protein